MVFILLLVFLALSALFSGAEIAYLSTSKLWVELQRKKGSRQGAILARFYEKPSQFIGTMLVGNNIALVVFTSLATIPLNQFLLQAGIVHGGLTLILNTLIITIVVLIFGEFFPKVLFRLFAENILYTLSYPLLVLYWLLALPALAMTSMANFLLVRIAGSPQEEIKSVFTRLDLENFIKSSRTEADEEIDTELFEKALNLREVRARETMVPRPEIEAIDVQASIPDLIALFRETNLSRLLVYETDIDHILGYVHHQQILSMPASIREIVLPIQFVPESMRVRDLIAQFIKFRLNVAVVVDEYGGTAGIVTMEDLLEEIFGEIEDEHDEEEYVDEEVGEGEYLFSGRLEVEFLNGKYPNLQLPEGEYTTLGGYLTAATGEIPVQGSTIALNGYDFTIEEVSDTRIELVRLKKQEDQK